MKKGMKFQLLIIDPQQDFMNSNGSALPVQGANADMDRLASLIQKFGNKIYDIAITLDSHQVLDYRHPGTWFDQNGKNPLPITQGGGLISADDIRNGIWNPLGANSKPKVLGGKTVKEFMVVCAEKRAQEGVPGIEIWPEHCLIGSAGWAIQPNLFEALSQWQRKEQATPEFITKGSCIYTEHYGGLEANVPIPADPSTCLNTNILKSLQRFDIIGIAGEASSHCVLITISQIVQNIGQEHLKKFVLFTDCMSPVGAVPNGPDFPKIAEGFLLDMRKLGMTLSTSKNFF